MPVFNYGAAIMQLFVVNEKIFKWQSDQWKIDIPCARWSYFTFITVSNDYRMPDSQYYHKYH